MIEAESSKSLLFVTVQGQASHECQVLGLRYGISPRYRVPYDARRLSKEVFPKQAIPCSDLLSKLFAGNCCGSFRRPARTRHEAPQGRTLNSRGSRHSADEDAAPTLKKNMAHAEGGGWKPGELRPLLIPRLRLRRRCAMLCLERPDVRNFIRLMGH